MTTDDAEAVAALVAGSWERTYAPLMGKDKVRAQNTERHAPDRIAADMNRPHSESFVAVTGDGQIVGYAFADVVKGVLWLDRLHVAADHHGSGVAAGLLHAVMANYVGEPSISLEVIEGNERAVRFYEKQGFQLVERKSACGGMDGVPTLVMRRALSRA